MERVRKACRSVLAEKGSVKQRVEDKRAAAKRRFRAELLEHQLLDWVIEHAKSGTDARLTCATKQLAQYSVLSRGAPGQTDSWGEGLVIGLRKPVGDALVPRHDQSQGEDRSAGAIETTVSGPELPDQKNAAGIVRLKNTRIDCVRLSGPEGLYFLPGVCQRRVEFPPQAIVQSQTGPEFPTILGKEINGLTSHPLFLRRTLTVFIGKPEEIVWKQVLSRLTSGRIRDLQTRVVGPSTEIEVLAADIEEERLVKSLRTEISAEFQIVFPDGLAEVVRPLIGISNLWQFALEIVAEVEPAGNIDERHAFTAGAQFGMDTKVWVIRIGEAVRGRDRLAGILDQRGVLGVQERALAFPEEREARLVHRRRTESPGVADVKLLDALVSQIAEIRHISAAGLEPREGFRQIVLREVVVAR